MEFAWRRGTLPAINNLVDTYNLVSLQSRFSLGAHDLERLTLPVSLQIFAEDQPFIPLGADQSETVQAGEFGYVDASEQIICRLDVRQAEFSKVTGDTTDAILIIEGTNRHTEVRLQEVRDRCLQFIPAQSQS